jgi:acetolactate synthase-1/3 small subunit
MSVARLLDSEDRDRAPRTAQHAITALVQNEAGTLNRLVSLFRRRGFSLASLNAGDCEQEGFSRLTLVVNGDESTLVQCVRQLEKLIDVVEVDDVQPHESVRRELALVQVQAAPGQRSEVLEIVQVLGAKVVHLAHDSMAIEFTDEPHRVDRLIDMLEPYGVKEVVRTGLVAMRVEA